MRKSAIHMASMALLVAQMGGNIPVHVGPSEQAKTGEQKPTGKRANTKAARKQRKKGGAK